VIAQVLLSESTERPSLILTTLVGVEKNSVQFRIKLRSTSKLSDRLNNISFCPAAIIQATLRTVQKCYNIQAPQCRRT